MSVCLVLSVKCSVLIIQYRLVSDELKSGFLTCVQLTFPVRVVASLGVKVLIATNACGSLNRDYNVGDFVIISDHINLPGLVGLNPLTGLCDDR